MKYGTLLLSFLAPAALLLAGCVSVGGGGDTRSVGGPAQWLSFGPVEAIAGGKPYLLDTAGVDIANDGRGRWVFVASAPAGAQAEKDLLASVSSDNGDSWSEPAPLHPHFAQDAVDDTSPRLVTDGAGRWVTVWNAWRRTGSGTNAVPEVLFARSVDAGRTWTAPARVNTVPGASSEELDPVLACDGQRTWMCAWIGHDPTGADAYAYVMLAVSSDDGATWSAPRRLYRGAVPGAAALHTPALASDGVRTFTVAWTETYSPAAAPRTDRIVAVSTRDRGETWDRAAVVAEGYGMDLQLRYGAEQACLATWTAGRWVNDAWEPSGGVLVARSPDLGATWRAPVPAAPPGPATAFRLPRMDTDGQGNWLLVWEAWSYAEQDSDVWASVSRDNGRSWSPAAVIHAEDPADRAADSNPVVRTDRHGRWLIQWSRAAAGGDALLYRLNDLPRAWWRDIEVGVGLSGSIPL